MEGVAHGGNGAHCSETNRGSGRGLEDVQKGVKKPSFCQFTGLLQLLDRRLKKGCPHSDL